MSAQARALTAADVLEPGPGDLVEVETGTVLAFALDPAERRIPLCAVPAGESLAGCAPAAGPVRLLVSGLPGTIVRVRRLGGSGEAGPEETGSGDTDSGEAGSGEATSGEATSGEAGPAERTDQHIDRLQPWISRLGDAVANGRWPRRLVPLAAARELVAPGEHVGGGADATSLEWVRVRSGHATWCGEPAAVVRTGDPAFPLPRGTWLTAGLRFRAVPADPPRSPQDWAAALDVLGRLSLAALAGRRTAADAATVARLEQREQLADAATEQAVEILAAAVGGLERVPQVTDQRRSAELAAAAVVARASGLPVDDQALARAADEVESGRDAVAAVAAACGGRPRAITLTDDWWRVEGSPVIVRVLDPQERETRPAAAIRRRGWVLIDPRGGEERAVDAELAETVDRHALELLPILPATPATLADLGRLAVRGSRRELVAVGAITLLLACLSFVTPFFLGQLATLFVASSAGAAYAGLFGALLLVVVAGTAWQAVRALGLLRARSQAAAISAGALWERIMRQRASWHAQRTLGDRCAQASAVNNASAALPDETVARLLDVATVAGSMAAIATTNAAMLLGLGVLIALQVLLTMGLLHATARRAEERVEAAAAATGRLMELLRAVNRLRVAGAESRAFLRWAQVQAPFSRADLALRRITMTQGMVVAVWPILTLVVVVVVTSTTEAGFGAFVTAQTASAAASLAVAAMSLSANGALVARQSLRKAAPVLEEAPEGGADGAAPGVLSGGLDVRDLVFSYGPGLPAVLDGVSLTVRPGEHVAIVGPSGCGKTTLMRILLGLEDPDSGVIAVDGQDLAALDRPAVRRQIGSVLQSSSLLPCSIKDNVDMGRAMAHGDVWAALDAAAVGEDVRALAMGLDTPVTDGGGTLSGGQRQRILIARALAGSPRMLILDEATSALDNLTQAAVVSSLEALRITRIVVAHRLSTIRSADRVIVLSAGRVVDQGTYDDLMSRPGVFRDLAERQQA